MRSRITFFFLAAGMLLAQGEPVKTLEEGPLVGGLFLDFKEISAAENQKESPASTEDRQKIPEKYLAAYFAGKPAGYLIDPQGLLAADEKKTLVKLLEYHAEESAIDLVAYVFRGDQKIPREIREETSLERLPTDGKSAAVIYYFLGAPERTAMYLSPMMAARASAAEYQRTLASSVMQAVASTSPFGQFEVFLEQVSNRIYSMERITKSSAREPIPSQQGSQPFSEKKTILDQAPEISLRMKRMVPILAGSFGGLVVLFCTWAWWRRRARFRFPEFEIEPRMGGSHAAGIGAVISFGSPAIPPAIQRNRVPEYMRRA